MRPRRSVCRLLPLPALLLAAPGAWGQHSLHPATAAARVAAPAGAADGVAPLRDRHPLLLAPVSIRLHDTAPDEALKAVAAAAGVSIAFSADALPAGRTVSLDVAGLPLGEVIREVLRDAALDARVAPSGQVVIVPRRPDAPDAPEPPAWVLARPATGMAGAAQGAAVQGIVTGQVVDAATGQPIAGAQVTVVGTQLGARTGADGRFTISGVPEGEHEVQVTGLGFAPVARTVTVATGGTATLSFALTARAVALEGVVAVGYGTQRRQDVTGSVASVSQTRLEDLPNTSVAQVLQGSAAGVGITTTGAGAEQSFKILIRGQNSIKASNDPLVVVDGIPYNGNLAEINPTDISAINILKDASAGAIYGARGANGVILITTKKGRVGRPQITYDGYAGVQEVAKLPRVMTGAEFARFKCDRLSEHQTCEKALQGTEWESLQAGRFTDWFDLATRRGVQQQHTLSASGGSEETRYYVSGSLLDTEGVARNDQFQRYTLRVNLDQKLGSWLELGINTQMSQSDRGGMPASFSGAFSANPLVPAFEEDGRTLALTPWPEDPQRSNPLQSLLVTDDDLSRQVRTGGYFEARLPFLAGLSYRLNGGADYLTRDAGRYYGRNTRVGLDSQGQALTESRRGFDWTVENILRYTHAFGGHSLDLTALYGAQSFSREENTLESRGFPNDVLTYRQAQLGRSVIPAYAVQESGFISQMGRINYGYDGRYLLTLTARRDGYSGFGDNYKYGVFPSIALAWNLSDEPFWRLESVGSLKLRLSYGQNGNQAIQPYQTLAQLAERSSVDGGATWPGFIPATLGNRNLRWETTTSLNGGADFSLLSDRLSGSLDLYSSVTRDLLLDRLISPVHGIERMVENIGRVQNRGVELSLSGAPLETARFAWTTEFNVSANRNRILDLYGDGSDDILNEWFIGQSINTNYGWVFDGVWQVDDDIAHSAQPTAKPGETRVRDVNGDGKVDAQDRTFLGHEDPSYIAGLSNTLRFGKLSLTAFLHTVQGVTRYNPLLLAEVAGGATGVVRDNALYFDYWTPENRSNTRWANREDANTFGAGQHDLGVGVHEDASFIRLKDVMVSYDLPEALAGRVGAGGLRIYANGRNLWTHTRWTGMDPELSSQTAIPLERLFTLGINARF